MHLPSDATPGGTSCHHKKDKVEVFPTTGRNHVNVFTTSQLHVRVQMRARAPEFSRIPESRACLEAAVRIGSVAHCARLARCWLLHSTEHLENLCLLPSCDAGAHHEGPCRLAPAATLHPAPPDHHAESQPEKGDAYQGNN